MCTLVAWVGILPGRPLVVAANRDEKLGRPSLPPRRHEGRVPYLAPVDLVAGGSWWALGDEGLFVALTNRMGAAIDPARASRGELVTRVVQAKSMEEAEALLAAIDPACHNGFHLFVTDGMRAAQLISDGVRAQFSRLSAGLHVMTERSFGAAASRDALVKSWAAEVEPSDATALASMLTRHGEPAFDGLCVHLPEHDYGTRSSTIVQAASEGGSRVLFADGPPCRTPFVEIAQSRA